MESSRRWSESQAGLQIAGKGPDIGRYAEVVAADSSGTKRRREEVRELLKSERVADAHAHGAKRIEVANGDAVWAARDDRDLGTIMDASRGREVRDPHAA